MKKVCWKILRRVYRNPYEEQAIEEHKHTFFFLKCWSDSSVIPNVEQKHVDIDALIPIDLHAILKNTP